MNLSEPIKPMSYLHDELAKARARVAYRDMEITRLQDARKQSEAKLANLTQLLAHRDWKIERMLAREIEINVEAMHLRDKVARHLFDSQAAAREQTDLSKRLREKATQPFGPEDFALLSQAADEIERYYGGMMAWKRSAEMQAQAVIESLPAADADAVLLEYFNAATAFNNAHGEGSTLEDERKAEARFDAATQAAHKAVSIKTQGRAADADAVRDADDKMQAARTILSDVFNAIEEYEAIYESGKGDHEEPLKRLHDASVRAYSWLLADVDAWRGRNSHAAIQAAGKGA